MTSATQLTLSVIQFIVNSSASLELICLLQLETVTTAELHKFDF